MNEEQLDRELTAWFSHQRETEGANAPAFGELWSNVRARHEREKRRALLRRVSAIAAVFVLLGVMVTMVRSRSDPKKYARNESHSLGVPWRTTVLVSEWRAPTDFLLTAPCAGFASLIRDAERWNKDSTFRPNRIN